MNNPEEVGSIQYACYVCNYIAAEKVSLLKHIRLKHGENKYACNQNKCKNKARNVAEMKIHFELNHAAVETVMGEGLERHRLLFALYTIKMISNKKKVDDKVILGA